MKKKAISLALALLLTLGLLSSCASGTSSTPADGSAAVPAASVSGDAAAPVTVGSTKDTLIVAQPNVPSYLDPQIQASLGTFRVTTQIFDRLLSMNTDMEMVPGLVDGHNHLCNTHMNLARMFSMDYGDIARHQLITVHDPYGWHTPESLYDISLCSALNALKRGATTISNCTILPRAAHDAMAKSGVRGILAPQIATSFRLKADNLTARQSLDLTEQCIREYHDPDNGFSVVVHIHDTWDCLDSVIEQAFDMAVRYDTKFVSHFYEFPDAAQRDDALWKEEGGSFDHYRSMGIIGPRSVFFHGCMLSEERMDRLAELGASLIHNPDINGTNCGNCAYVPYMLKAGINVGLGSDCGALDMFGAMKLMLFAHNIMPRQYKGVAYRQPLQAATLGSARAYGMAHMIGSLEAGKRADVITIDLANASDLVPLVPGAIEVQPEMLFFLFTRSAAGQTTSETMVDGRLIRENGRFTELDEEKIIADAAARCADFLPDMVNMRKTDAHYATRLYDDFVRDEDVPARYQLDS